MWGNLNGWIISTGVALIMGYLLWKLAAPPAIPAPTGSKVFSVTQQPVAFPIPAANVTKMGVQSCSAAPLYRQAIAECRQHPALYERFNVDVPLSQLTAIDHIVKARDCDKCDLFAANPSEVVNYDNDEPPLQALQKVGTLCCTYGMLNRQEKKLDEAQKLLEAAFVLGVHLCNERVSWAEFSTGHDLIQQASINLVKLYNDRNDTARAQEVEHFMSEEKAYDDKLVEAFKIVNQVDEVSMGRYAGDIFAIAENKDADPMFRVEALKHIGHYRYNAQTAGEQMGSRRILRRLPEEVGLNPAVKAAAVAAQNLTQDQHRAVGGSVD